MSTIVRSMTVDFMITPWQPFRAPASVHVAPVNHHAGKLKRQNPRPEVRAVHAFCARPTQFYFYCSGVVLNFADFLFFHLRAPHSFGSLLHRDCFGCRLQPNSVAEKSCSDSETVDAVKRCTVPTRQSSAPRPIIVTPRKRWPSPSISFVSHPPPIA